jgi:WD40 repeat protein
MFTFNDRTLTLVESRAVPDEYISAEFSPEGDFAIVFDMLGNPGLIDVRSGTSITALQRGWTAMAWSPDSSQLALGYEDGSIHILKTLEGNPELEINFTDAAITRLSFSPGGGIIMAVDYYDWVGFWDGTDGREINRVFIQELGAVEISVDELTFVNKHYDALRVLSIQTGLVLWTLIDEFGRGIDYEYSPDGKTVTTYHDYGRRKEMRVALTGTYLGQELLEGRMSLDESIHPNGLKRFELREGYKIILRSIEGWRELVSTTVPTFGECVTIAPDGLTFASNTGLWDLETGEQLIEFEGYCPAKYSPDGVSLFVRLDDRVIGKFDTRPGRRQSSFSCHSQRRNRYDPEEKEDFAISHSGEMLACYDSSGQVKVFDIASEDQINTLYAQGSDSLIIFSSDDTMLGAMGLGYMRVWDLTTGYLIHDPIRVDYPDFWWISDDLSQWHLHYRTSAMMRSIWDPRQVEELSVVYFDPGRFWNSDFSPDGSILAFTYNDGIHFWDTESLQELGQVEWVVKYYWYAGITFSPDSMWLAVFLDGGPVWLWEVSAQ